MVKLDTARLTSLALLSGSGLFLEIALTRLFSALFYPHHVYSILALAVLGIGLGASLGTWLELLRRRSLVPTYLLLASLASLGLVFLATWAPGLSFQLPLFVLVVPPYLFSGLSLAALFSSDPEASPRLYRADLIGAGLGALTAIPFLDLWGPINGILLAASLLGWAGFILILADRQSGKGLNFRLWFALVITLIGVLGFGTNLHSDRLSLTMTTLPAEKPIVGSLAKGGRILKTTWDSFARTDVVDPGDGSPYQLYMDGAAASVMPPHQGNDFLYADIGLFPFATTQPQRIFIIGPGGGLDVWFGLLAEADEIVAVEVNPASIDLVREFADYNGDLYGQSSVRIIEDEGRSVLRREQATYDLIFLSQVVTLAAERNGYALVENSSFTVEAFQDYLEHLQPDGLIVLKLYDELTLTRALSTALAALQSQDLTDTQALKHIIALLDSRADPPIPLLMIRKSAFNRDEALELGAVAQRVGFSPLFLPEVFSQPPLDAVAAGELPFTTIVDRAESDISPTSDDRPFFYQFERGVPNELQSLLQILAGVVLVGAILLIPVQRGVAPARLRLMPLYFAALGAGFMLVEVAIIQQTRLFLGHPTLAVIIVLAVLLIGGGLGSGLAGRRYPAEQRKLPSTPAVFVAALVIAWLAAWPSLSQIFSTSSPALRTLLVGVSLLPLALAMGMPMPLGLRHAGRIAGRQVALGWAVNGIMTVVGSAIAVTLAIVGGFNQVLLAGAFLYVLAAVLARSLAIQATGTNAEEKVPGTVLGEQGDEMIDGFG